MARYDTLDDLRAGVKLLREEAKKLQSHLAKMLEDYSDFEDRILEIDLVIAQAEKDVGITKEKVEMSPAEAVFDELELE